MFYTANNNPQMVKNLHMSTKQNTYKVLGLRKPHIPYFLQESLWLKSYFETEQIRANKNSCCVDSSLLCKVLLYNIILQ
jgi:hypothetical protein